jgi:hypothetical protein
LDLIRRLFNKSAKKEYRTLDEQPEFFFGVVASYTLKSGASYYYDYQIAPAYLKNTTPWNAYTKTGVTGTFPALSLSEIGNQGSSYSFGVPVGDVPVGFTPKAIPVGTPVIAVRQLTDTGQFKYIILNTQAISGSC